MEEHYRVPVTQADRDRAGLALHVVSISTGVPVAPLNEARLGLIATRARRMAMYLANVTYGWSLERVGHAFGVNRATAATGARWAEDLREDPVMDALFDRMEQSLKLVADPSPLETAA